MEDLEDLNDDNSTIIMFGENGEEIEFTVVDAMEHNGTNYLLVIETELAFEDESEAMILKEVSENGEDFFYATIEDDNEFDKIVNLFQSDNEEYEIEV
jgi:uncharacterized protein YrzB (UPF0473 family)